MCVCVRVCVCAVLNAVFHGGGGGGGGRRGSEQMQPI